MIEKSTGKTASERTLAEYGDRTFFQAWSYANPINDAKKEFCDLLAIFDNHMFIFFDREKSLPHPEAESFEIYWNRWEKQVIQKQIRTCDGAERYIRSGRKLFLDQTLDIPLPIPYAPDTIVHKIIIAHGAAESCKASSAENVSGSLAISYGESRDEIKGESPLFFLHLSRNDIVHVFDTSSAPIIFSELDTFFDFASYIIEKEKAIQNYRQLLYCGEEDLLAHYFLNFDPNRNSHYIGSKEEVITSVMIGEGEWDDFIKTPAYMDKKKADEVSYLWDRLLEKTCANALNGTLMGNGDLFAGKSAITEMAKEPRFSRRALSQAMISAIQKFPQSSSYMVRNVSYMPSFYKNRAYVFLQLKIGPDINRIDDYRAIRQKMLEVACAAMKNRVQELGCVIGIAVEPPRYSEQLSEDFVLLDCRDWTEDIRRHYEEENAQPGMGFFASPNMTTTHKSVKEFPNEALL